MREPDHRQLLFAARLDGNCQGSTTPQEQCKQGTEPYSRWAKAQNQAAVRCPRHCRDSSSKELSHTASRLRFRAKATQGWGRQATGTVCLSTQRVLAQDEGARLQATAAIIRARRQLSGVHDTAGTVQARNWAIQPMGQGSEPSSCQLAMAPQGQLKQGSELYS